MARAEPDRAAIVSKRSPTPLDADEEFGCRGHRTTVVAPTQRRDITLATVYVRVMPLFHKTMYTETIISAVIA